MSLKSVQDSGHIEKVQSSAWSAQLNGSGTGGAVEKPELREEGGAGCRPFCRGHSGLHHVPSYSEQQ
ncbi:hypothetical protein PHYPO_G00037200 [Pangasianodon hypophthalmus]|uniref:Uncharacterized protein n=1 Tax=Pangasianodon hypophthalmus TaxID=310915 RepID=A0A5N5MND1_PANHP|nr:hypothetical protein PHYPO_G00037200 [Pangasianodon hypophthalmus]